MDTVKNCLDNVRDRKEWLTTFIPICMFLNFETTHFYRVHFLTLQCGNSSELS